MTLSIAGLTGAALAARQERIEGVIIPDAERVYSDVSTDIRATKDGAIWSIPLPDRQAWQILKRSLQRLGVAFTETEGEALQLLTDWVAWGYDASTNTGHSKRPHFGSAGTTELHRFRFMLAKNTAGEPAGILITDAAYQKEVDIAPDSEYAWTEWRKFDPQPGAAYTFGRRLQGEYQAAMSLQPVSVLAPALPREPATTSIEPASGPSATVTHVVEPAIHEASKVVIPPPALPMPAKVLPSNAQAQIKVPVAPESRKVAAAPTTAGLLVNMPPEATWEALLRALEELKIDIETVDRNQLMIVTRWIEANYDPKNQQLIFRSNSNSGWAFNWLGGGSQRHRFQLVLISSDAGKKTLIRAYHTGFQEQVDQTPDSSQTILAWEDRKTSPDIASAFLRRLRIVDNR
ncbi:hypothetical protein [Thiogranum longum]|nr:hypothetical protein [Thiogranum longum]